MNGRLVAIVLGLVVLPSHDAARSQLPFAQPEFHSQDESERLHADHSHAPIDVDARPIVARMKVSVIRPRRMLLDGEGTLFVADWGSGAVLKVTDEGSTVLADNLDEPAGLAMDKAGNLYVAMHAQGMTNLGSVVRISPDGEQVVVAEGFTGPTDLAFDADGNLYVANFHENNVACISADGMISIFVEEIATPAALAFDTKDRLHIASSTEGAVYRVDRQGRVETIAQGLEVPSDLAMDPDGHLIVTNFAGTELTHLGENGLKRFAVVPKGTIGLAFDDEGNLALANWELQFLMKITLKLSVPCPHCEKSIPIRLRPRHRSSDANATDRPPI